MLVGCIDIYILRYYGFADVSESLIIICTVLMMFFLLASGYFMGIFGLLATSVRIRVITEIAKNGTHGLTYNDLLKQYNRDMIVKTRLDRFVSSGDIVYKRKTYAINQGIRFFMLPDFLLHLMEVIYGTN